MVIRLVIAMIGEVHMNKIYVLVLLIGLAISSTNCRGSDNSVWEFDIQADDVSLHACMAGDSDSGCVLVAINGGPGLTSNYMLDLETLVSTGCAVVTYDQRGLGQSSHPNDPDSPESYSLQKYAADLEAIRNEIGVDRIHLFGHSFGGIVAMQYAVDYPDRVASLIFYGSGPPTWVEIQESQANFSERLTDLIESGAIPPPSEWAENGIDPLLPAYFSDPAFTFPEGGLGGAPEYDQKVNDLTYQNLVGIDLRSSLKAFDQPVLLLFGVDDPFGVEMAESVQGALGNADIEMVLIESCGHFWHECPDEVYAHIRQFISNQ